MHLFVTDLAAFYASRLGQTVRRLLRGRIRRIWPDLTGRRVLGLGYAVPYLRPFATQAERVIAFMPGAQGVIAWPDRKLNLTALTEDVSLPLADESVDRVLIVHGLEAAESVRPMLREIWRILAPGGRLLVVVPNRRSLWALTEASPFGAGRPFSRSQLNRLLQDQMFTPVHWETALHLWPVANGLLLRWAEMFERLGARVLPGLAGVHLVEASKQIYGLAQGAGLPARSTVILAADRPSLRKAEPSGRGPRLTSDGRFPL